MFSTTIVQESLNLPIITAGFHSTTERTKIKAFECSRSRTRVSYEQAPLTLALSMTMYAKAQLGAANAPKSLYTKGAKRPQKGFY